MPFDVNNHKIQHDRDKIGETYDRLYSYEENRTIPPPIHESDHEWKATYSGRGPGYEARYFACEINIGNKKCGYTKEVRTEEGETKEIIRDW